MVGFTTMNVFNIQNKKCTMIEMIQFQTRWLGVIGRQKHRVKSWSDRGGLIQCNLILITLHIYCRERESNKETKAHKINPTERK
jgi:hypothetical protein